MNFIENESAQKLRGGYYTPIDLAAYISSWCLTKGAKSVLEPSCGDGVFFSAIDSVPHEPGLRVRGFELNESEAVKARKKAKGIDAAESVVSATDFLDWAIKQIVDGCSEFDAVVGNPPFVRYQYLPSLTQEKAELIFRLLHLPFTKHTNAWVPFVLASIAMLRPGGRLGMILPAEIMHVMHAQSLRTFLGTSCSKLLIIDPEEIWFEGTLQGAVILLAEKKLAPSEHGHGLGIVQVKGRDFGVCQESCPLF